MSAARKIDLSSDNVLRTNFKESSLEIFWAQCGNKFPVCHDAVMKLFIPFATVPPTYSM